MLRFALSTDSNNIGPDLTVSVQFYYDSPHFDTLSVRCQRTLIATITGCVSHEVWHDVEHCKRLLLVTGSMRASPFFTCLYVPSPVYLPCFPRRCNFSLILFENVKLAQNQSLRGTETSVQLLLTMFLNTKQRWQINTRATLVADLNVSGNSTLAVRWHTEHRPRYITSES